MSERIVRRRATASRDLRSSAVTGFLPVTSRRREDVLLAEGIYDNDATVLARWTVDHDYVATMGMEIVEGRDFSTASASDSMAATDWTHSNRRLSRYIFIGGYSNIADSKARSFTNAVSWRVSATLTTTGLVYITTGKISLALAVGALEVVTICALYYIRERLWRRITLGTKLNLI